MTRTPRPSHSGVAALSLAPQDVAAAEVELRKLRHEVAYMQNREESLQQDLSERKQEVQVVRDALSGVQEKYNGLRLEAMRLEQKVGKSWFLIADSVWCILTMELQNGQQTGNMPG